MRSPVLTPDDLPWPELQAAALDGDVYAIGDAFAPIDEFDRSLLRAESIARTWPRRVIAERRSAAWVLGALDRAPLVHELCTDTTARTKHPLTTAVQLREVVMDQHDIVRVGRLGVTSPVRTIVDLARIDPVFGEAEAEACRRLLALPGATVEACRVLMDRRRNLPGKNRAWQRIRSL